MDALKRIEKINREDDVKQKKLKTGLEFNPGLVLISLRTTGPCSLRHGSHKSGNVQGMKKILQGQGKVREFYFESGAILSP